MPKAPEKTFHSKYDTLPSNYRPILMKIALRIYRNLEAKTRRTVYVRSSSKSYFQGQKIFLNLYFPHLKQKSPRIQVERLKFFEAGLDLVKNTPYEPTIKSNPNKPSEQVMRFWGETRGGKKFCVQVRVNKRGNHYLMSTFPVK